MNPPPYVSLPRVRYREETLQLRRKEREAGELQKQREQEERQTRLEALRNQVGGSVQRSVGLVQRSGLAAVQTGQAFRWSGPLKGSVGPV